MIARVLLIGFAIVSATMTASAQEGLAARAQALRAKLDSVTDARADDRGDFLRRQLLSSLERRQDLERARSDTLHLMKQADAATLPLPEGLLALDDLRRELQRFDASLAGGERRRAILDQERAALAKQLAERVANQRALVDAGVTKDRLELAKLEAEFAESSISEIDGMRSLIDAQQRVWTRQRGVRARRLAQAAARGAIQVKQADVATIEQRLQTRTVELRERLTAAAMARGKIRAELRQTRSASPARVELLKQQLTNADFDIELAREALNNTATEQAAWQIALRYYRDGDPKAIVEASKQADEVLERLQRRHEFLAVLSEQINALVGGLTTDLARAPMAPDVLDKRALRAVYENRLQLVQAALFDGRQLIDLLGRLHDDFDQRIGLSNWQDRSTLALTATASWFTRVWNFELFTVNQTIKVQDRETAIPRGVTVGKLVKAPLLLLFSLWLAFRTTGWGERWLVGRRGADAGNARLLRRWVLALLMAGCVLASLALAGIPLAAFAFIGGAVAIGIGFGMQTLFKNLISGALVLVERPFRLGDVIEIGDLRGTVVDIDLRTSVVRDSDGADTLIPNSAFMEQNVKNVTFRSRISRQMLPVVVDGASDPRLVSDVMCAAAARHGQLLESPEPTVLLDEFTESGLRFVLHYWIDLKPGMDRRRVASDLRLMVLNVLQESDIRLAPPPR